jgi:hypothetical protein
MAEQPALSERARNLKQRGLLEFKKFMAIFLYLWVVFALLSIHETIIRAQHGLDYEAHTFAVINAFVFAKVLLVGEHFRLGTRFKHKPLIYPVLYKCLVFSVLLTGFHIVEKIVAGVIGGETLSQGLADVDSRTLVSIVSMSTLAFVMLIPFFAFRELGQLIGQKELRSLFLGRGVISDVGKPETTVPETEERKFLGK